MSYNRAVAMTAEINDRAATFEAQRGRLFGIAYRMLGSAAEAEDVVQDAWFRYSSEGQGGVASPRAFLATVVTRLCIDRARSARARREEYVGPWLPEPIVTAWGAPPSPEQVAGSAETLRMASVLLLERLSPVERAVFVLHEAFDYSHGEIAEAVGITGAASRQHLRRARLRLADGRRRYAATEEAREQLARRFLAAAGSGDLPGLLALLADDVVATSDGGGRMPSAQRPVYGKDRVARFIAGVSRKEAYDRLEPVFINGEPGALLWRGGRLLTAAVFAMGPAGVVDLFLLRNPEKLRRVTPGAL